MKNRKLAAVTMFALVGTVAAGCSSGSSKSSTANGGTSTGATGSSATSSQATSSGGTVNVLVVADQSGPNKSIGTQEALGVQAAAGYLNSQGGLLGKTVKVTILNDNGDPTTATSELVQALSQNPNKYSMVYPGEEGTIVAALIPVLKRDGVYAVSVNDGNSVCVQASACPTQFSINGPSPLQTTAPSQWFAQQKLTNVGVIDAQLDFTENEATTIGPQLAKEGIKSETASFPLSAVSVTSEMQQLKSAGAQAVFAAAFGAPVGYILGARSQLGWNVPVVFDVAGASFNIPGLAPASQLSNVYETAFRCMNPANNMPALALISKYAPTKEDPTVPCNQVAGGWDATMVFAGAAKAAKSLSPSALVTATEGLKLSASTTPLADYGGYCYTSTDHENACQSASDWNVVPVGKIVNTRLAPLNG